ncbi:hypothetical protein [Pantanalinema sp. GBBB05]
MGQDTIAGFKLVVLSSRLTPSDRGSCGKNVYYDCSISFAIGLDSYGTS